MTSLTTPHFAALDALPGIDLAELVSRASLMARVDRKYVLDRADLDAFGAELPVGTRVLDIEGRRRFGYSSTYLDTPDLTSYRQAAWGRDRRYKVRSRDYLDSGGRFIEVKTKVGAASHKLRRPLTGEADQALDFVSEVLDEAHLAADRVEELEPVLQTHYTRSTLLDPSGTGRVTIDTDLRWRGIDGGELDLPDLAIVETKSAGARTDLDLVLWRLGHRPQRISKYATGLAALRPDLPHNRWHRLLITHFTPLRKAHR